MVQVLQEWLGFLERAVQAVLVLLEIRGFRWVLGVPWVLGFLGLLGFRLVLGFRCLQGFLAVRGLLEVQVVLLGMLGMVVECR